MKMPIAKRLAAGMLVLSITAGALGLTAGTSLASPRTQPGPARAGLVCTRAQLNKTSKSGKELLVCMKVGDKYKWELEK